MDVFPPDSQRTHQMNHPFAWQYSEGDGDLRKWKVMDENYQRFYEECYQAGLAMLTFPHAHGHGGKKTYEYEVDFVAMTQTNKSTKTVRSIRRATPQQILD